MKNLNRLAGGLLSALALFVAVVMGPTGASYIASVSNSTDKARTNQYWTCYEAEAMKYLKDINTNNPPVPEIISEFNVKPSGTSYTQNYGSRDYGDLIHDDIEWFPLLTDYPPVQQTGAPCGRDPAPYATNQLVHFQMQGTKQMFAEYEPAPTLDVGPIFTAVTWFKSDGAAGAIMGQYEDGSDLKSFTHVLYIGSNGVLYFGDNVGNGTAKTSMSSGVNVVDGKWHFAAMRSDGSRIYLYLDGVSVASQAWAAGYITTGVTQHWRWGSSNLPIMIGYFTNLADIQYRGYLAASAVYAGRMLADPDIAAIYYAGKS